MGRPKKAVPSYLLHKPTGQARVRIDGREIYLGRCGATESKEAYARLVAEHAARAAQKSIEVPIGQPFTVSSLIVKYDDYVRQYHVSQGKPTEEIYRIRAGIRALVKLYSSLPVAEFSPLKLKAVREEIIRAVETAKGSP